MDNITQDIQNVIDLESLQKHFTKLLNNKSTKTKPGIIFIAIMSTINFFETKLGKKMTLNEQDSLKWNLIGVLSENHPNDPVRLLNYAKMLYPQNEFMFTRLDKETIHWLAHKAHSLIKENPNAPLYYKIHWEKLVNQQLPFGYKSLEE